jgi:hypothetical protein
MEVKGKAQEVVEITLIVIFVLLLLVALVLGILFLMALSPTGEWARNLLNL